jgi:hypothetical protein
MPRLVNSGNNGLVFCFNCIRTQEEDMYIIISNTYFVDGLARSKERE